MTAASKMLTSSLLGLAFVFASLLPSEAQAPKKGPVITAEKRVPLDQIATLAVDPQRPRHGMRVAVTLKDGDIIVGTCVRNDDAKGSLHVRTEPMQPPKEIPWANIGKCERIRPTKNGEPVPDESEIHALTHLRGEFATVKYFAPNLSSEEKRRLADLEASENEVAFIEKALDLKIRCLDADYQQKKELAKTLELLNSFIKTHLDGDRRIADFPANFPTALQLRQLPSSTTKVFDEVNPQMLAKAREQLSLARKQAVYEEGRIIAVTLEK